MVVFKSNLPYQGVELIVVNLWKRFSEHQKIILSVVIRTNHTTGGAAAFLRCMQDSTA